MKRFLTFICLLYSVAAFAQPVNDDCLGLIDLGIAPACDTNTIYNNVDATATDIGFDNIPTGCTGGDFVFVGRDVWFSFIASDTIFDYKVEVTGCPDLVNGFPSILNPQIAIYRGDCEFDGLQLLDCIQAEAGATTVKLNLNGLTPGIPYFIRINDWSASAAPNSGGFKLCVDVKDPIIIIGEESFTDDCEGEVFDSGGPDGDYENNENNILTICPSEFHNCLNFTLEYYNVDNAGDQINFYDGPDVNSPLIGQTNGGDFEQINSGGVCFAVAASSGCLTLEFISDGNSTFEGFHGFWECTQNECVLPEPITVDILADDQAIIDNITTPQTIVTIDNINCADGAIGTFEAPNSDLGLDKGLIITSGNAVGAIGPSNNFSSGNTGTGSDVDLDAISINYGNGTLSNDACVIELDVFAATDELTFEYVFGSEEYPEFAVSNFNDIFAFLISGPGIDGDPVLNNQLNIATLPDGTFVEIANVNDGVNWEYYRDNLSPFGIPNNQLGLSIGYDGLTSDFLGVKKSLTARADVEPCNTYHLKLAIADRSDSAWDSGVFISELKGGTPEIGVQYFNGIEYLVEGCTSIPDQIVINLNIEQDDTTSFTVVISGTAELGVDYLLDIPTPVVLLPGQTQVAFPITPLIDNIDEDDETIILELTNDFGCGAVTFSTTTITLRDELKVDIFSGADTVFVCENTCINMIVDGAQDYFWTPPGQFSPPDVADPEFCPTVSQFIEVLGTLGVCSDMDTIWAQVVAPEVEIDPLDVTNICIGDSVTMVAINNVGNSNLMWTPAIGLSDPNEQTVEAQPTVNTDYIATVELQGCMASDTITLNVDLFDFPVLTTTDTTICQNFSVTLAANIPNTTTQFEWTSIPNDPSMSCTDCPNPVVTPELSTVYSLTATSENAYCSALATIDIEVIPANVAIQNPDTLEICLGEEVDLSSIVSNDGSGFSWTPDASVANDTLLNTTTAPTETTQYFAFLTIGGCTVVDSMLIIVDSLPDLAIMAIPEKESYCEGEEVILVSTTYEPADYPFIEFLWDPLTGVQTPDSNLNLVLLTVDTTVYVRTTVNRGCTSVDSIQIDVVPTAGMTLMPADTTVCPGEPVQMFLTLDNPNITDISYEPGNAVNCSDCFDPIGNVLQTTTINVSADFDGCPVGTQATINITNPPSLTFPSDNDLCLGEDITLNTNPDPGNTYIWTASDGSEVPNEPAPNVSPTSTTTYSVTVDNGICDLSLDFPVNVFENPNLALPVNPVICSDESIQLNLVTDPSATYQWTGDGGFSSTNPQPTVTPGSEGIFNYTVVASNPGCTIENTFSVQVNEAPAFIEPADLIICEGDAIDLNEAAQTPGVIYNWTASDGTPVTDPDNVSPVITTTYSLSASNGPCPIEASFTVEVIQEVDVTASALTPICDDDDLELMGDAGGNVGTYTWSIPTGQTWDGENVTVPAADLGPGSYIFTLEYDNDLQDCSFIPASGDVEVTINDFTPITGGTITTIDEDFIGSFDETGAVPDSIEVVEGESIIIMIQLADGGIYTWSIEGTNVEDNGNTQTIIVPLIDEDDNGFLNFSINLENSSGCESFITVSVPIIENIIQFPNAFTPNGDNTNDVFRLVPNTPVEILNFQVYNRWGKEVYSATNIRSDEGWDGMDGGDPAAADVYLYTIKYKKGAREITGKGDVTLIR